MLGVYFLTTTKFKEPFHFNTPSVYTGLYDYLIFIIVLLYYFIVMEITPMIGEGRVFQAIEIVQSSLGIPGSLVPGSPHHYRYKDLQVLKSLIIKWHSFCI